MLEFNMETLKQPCQPVPDDLKENGLTLDIKHMARAMFEVIDKYNGWGLAANQVGYLWQIICINYKGTRRAIINPVITKKRGGMAMAVESCLSAPKNTVRLPRFKIVTVTGLDENMVPIKLKARGTLARIIQHECDHMTGITIWMRKGLGPYGELKR